VSGFLGILTAEGSAGTGGTGWEVVAAGVYPQLPRRKAPELGQPGEVG
jgi:hypothetical protein